jgi:hypothetical protein
LKRVPTTRYADGSFCLVNDLDEPLGFPQKLSRFEE